MSKLFLSIGAINAALAVMLGAFGAHGLKERLTVDMLDIFETAVQYHFYHALGLLAVGLLAIHYPESGSLKWAGWLMLAGIVIFSGSLYILSVSGIRWLGAITPLGGISFIAAWVLLLIAVAKTS
ncbi:DUF423 domain-containing protein [Halalkalibaculum sp. DA3122]|uniref:DUF423 domain-containing protein n=1 Tax=Halalkalibaculum sp. DA3122 TaxID=3373607 RepID=UPI00375483FB